MIEFHEIANLFPMINDDQLDELVQDIKANGLREPGYIYEGKILDGRNRATACEIAGVEFEYYDFEGDDPLSFVLSLNLIRRHMTKSQLGVLGLDILEYEEAEAKKRKEEAGKTHGKGQPKLSQKVDQPNDNKAAAKVADKLGTNRQYVQDAKKLKADEERPDILSAVREGKINMSQAKELSQSDIPQAEREEIYASTEPKHKAIKDKKREINNEKIAEIKSQAVPTPKGLYDVIVIDPPWQMEKIDRDERPNQVGFNYPTMDEDELSNLEIPYADNCHVWVWTTHKHLPMALRLVETWCLKYVCTFTWHKNGGFQPYNLPQYNCEFALYCRRGAPKFTETKQFFTCFDAKRGNHSEKPQEFYDLVNRVTEGKRLDMFNRRSIEGFYGWGNEAGEDEQR